jgi:hypothetical protein
VPETPGRIDRVGFSLKAAWSKVDGGYRGALVGSGTGRWEWECLHESHATVQEALECARAEIRLRRLHLA